MTAGREHDPLTGKASIRTSLRDVRVKPEQWLSVTSAPLKSLRQNQRSHVLAEQLQIPQKPP